METKGAAAVEVLEAGERQLRLVLTGSSEAWANALRRGIMSDVEILAFDRLVIHPAPKLADVLRACPAPVAREVERNGGLAHPMMHDDMLFHRLSMVSLRCGPADLERILRRDECDCDDGCARCMVRFTCRVTNLSDDEVAVTTGDLVSHDVRVRVAAPTVAERPIQLLKLGKHQAIAFTAWATKSSMERENHAKWTPTAVAAYRPLATVAVNRELLDRSLPPAEQKRLCAAESSQCFTFDEAQQRLVVHPDAALRATYTGDFIEELRDLLHASTAEQPRTANDKPALPHKKPGLADTKAGPADTKPGLADTPGEERKWGAAALIRQPGPADTPGEERKEGVAAPIRQLGPADMPGEERKEGVAAPRGSGRVASRGALVEGLETERAQRQCHPTELDHPLMCMLPRGDAFLMPVVSTGCLPAPDIVRLGLASIRRRLLALQLANRRLAAPP
jgi:DNA-directed RNA polymerase alpha subunit